ncbi:MAG: carbonic anhydrase [Alphaproteobacteria bacterium]|nr:carbonic anhydrase [Alphaproteobacteria bacterium]
MTYHKLIEGFRQFQTDYFTNSDRYAALVNEGQKPETLVIGCSDSRNDPALLTRAEPGDIFVVRNVAALVPPYEPDGHYHGTSAAIEFAVKGLGVKNIIVLGHALCGGIETLAACSCGAEPGALDRNADGEAYEFLTPWVKIALAARKAVDAEMEGVAPAVRQRALEQAAVLASLNNLMAFPWIAPRVKDGRLKLHGWYFDMVGGKLLGFNPVRQAFEELAPESAP